MGAASGMAASQASRRRGVAASSETAEGPGAEGWCHLAGPSQPANWAATLCASPSQGVVLKSRQNVAGSPATGWETVVVASGLTTPGQICGILNGKLYVVTDSGTAISVIPLASLPATPTTAVSGLSATLACSLDLGGSGDLILADGADVYAVPAASLAGALPIPKASLTSKGNVGPTATAPGTASIITSVIGTTGVGRPGAWGWRLPAAHASWQPEIRARRAAASGGLPSCKHTLAPLIPQALQTCSMRGR